MSMFPTRKGTLLEKLTCLFKGHQKGELYLFILGKIWVVDGCLRCRKEFEELEKPHFDHKI